MTESDGNEKIVRVVLVNEPAPPVTKKEILIAAVFLAVVWGSTMPPRKRRG